VSETEEGWSRVVDQRVIAIETALDEIERELARHIIRLIAVERVAIAFALERFATRWPHERRMEPW
jgi:hypothetical protein